MNASAQGNERDDHHVTDQPPGDGGCGIHAAPELGGGEGEADAHHDHGEADRQQLCADSILHV